MKDPTNQTPASLAADMAAFPEMNPAPVIRADLQGRILLGNAAARSTFERATLEGENWLDLIGVPRPFWEAVVRSGKQHALEATVGERVLNFTYRLAPDG